jgi:CRISPR-associated protein Cmr2
MNFWKRKLAAYLHDPPSKALDIPSHGERSESAFRQAGFTDRDVGDYDRPADHTAAAADRLPFPASRPSGLQCAFDGIRNCFLHPLGQPGGKPLRLPFHAEFASVAQGFEGEGSVQPALSVDSLQRFTTEDEAWRARFFAHWRLWPEHCARHDYRLALLPADTRIPDHSIWTHMQMVSSLAGCVADDRVKPAFLKFQLGPVQDFIQAARSTRDLWSGSYLLSWLMAAGLKAFTAQVGPDAVIFPNLRGQPLFDLHWKAELWSKAAIGGSKTVWESLDWDSQDLLTPNLPNVFLAVVPANEAARLGALVTRAIQEEWKRIAAAVWTDCKKAALTTCDPGLPEAERKARFDGQIGRFLSLSWQATPWPETLKEALSLADGFDAEMPIGKARQRIQAVVEMATRQTPVEHRDPRCFVGDKEGPKTELNNVGLAWSVILAFNSWALDAVRQTRDFTATSGGWQTGTFQNKDALTGRDEAVAGGEKWKTEAEQAGEGWDSLFKHDDWLAAPNLVKRVWHRAYLCTEPWNLPTRSKSFPMPNTRGIAAHDPFAKEKLENDDDSKTPVEALPPSEKYFAVLAFDGDEIGKWVSGEKTPPIASQLASYQDHAGATPQGALAYFQRDSDPDGQGTLENRFRDFLQSQRPLSPGYHLQFSEALTNFSLRVARPVVEVFDGRLIYAGGDDVVALLPADTALACATALRLAFTGSEQLSNFLANHALRLEASNREAGRKVPSAQALAAQGRLVGAAQTTRDGQTTSHSGFLVRLDDQDTDRAHRRHSDGNNHPIPFVVPGPAADASVGIAIAHFMSPLQDVVRAAQQAEKRAKRSPKAGGLGRKAVAVTLMKRSGETVEWGTRWEGGLALYAALAAGLESETLSARFPHRFVALLEAYQVENTPLLHQTQSFKPDPAFPVDKIIRREFQHTLGRQQGPHFPRNSDEANDELDRFNAALDTHLTSLDSAGITTAEGRIQSLIGLCQTVAFAHRTAVD